VVLALSFYVLLAPALLWIGAALLAVRASLGLLARRTRPDQARPLGSWGATAVRWLGRRPGQFAAALVLGVMAVAFGAEVLAFNATYATAKQADARAAFGADLRIEPATDIPTPLPALGPELARVSPFRLVPARAGSDRKTLAAIDPSSYSAAIGMQPRIMAGGGVEALAHDPHAVVVSEEVASGFDVRIGDTLPVTVFPDDLDLAQKLELRVAGIFRSFPPDDPFAEMVINVAAVPAPVPAPDLYLARTTPAHGAGDVVTALHERGVDHKFAVMTISDSPRQGQRTLTALNLGGLGRIEALVACIAAGAGVGVLGALLVLERRREFAVLRTIGAGTKQLLVPTAVEAAVAAIGSVVIGVPLGVGLAIIAVRVLGIFFTLPPPVVTLPVGALGLFVLGVLAASAIALAVALRRIDRVDVAALLREP
jgi:putative ABC transport system permease protein